LTLLILTETHQSPSSTGSYINEPAVQRNSSSGQGSFVSMTTALRNESFQMCSICNAGTQLASVQAIVVLTDCPPVMDWSCQ